MTDPKTPVIVEWYTYERIPHIRHAAIVTAAQAAAWEFRGMKIITHYIDPLLHKECGYDSKAPSTRR
jgi:hypothetical protein